MSILESLFESCRETIWRQLAAEIDATYVGSWRGDKVVATHGEWEVTLDAPYNAGTKHADTRLRARFPNPSGFRFTVYRKSMFSGLAAHLGMQDVEVGDAEFDDAFVIQGNDEHRLKRLFRNERIRELLQAQPAVHFAAAAPHWLEPGKEEGKDWLVFTVHGIIRDKERLKGLFDLFAATLDELTAR